jgi:uncharacterized phage protein (TIGR02220 family)
MALRDQPYLPLYVQDYLTDEKLNECSASTQGIYIKIMCIMHKSEEYGCILLEQKYKQTDQQIKNFAIKLVKHLPFSEHEIFNALSELLNEKVLHLIDDKIYQKRMVEDNELSLKRSEAGQKGGFATANSTANKPAKDTANSEYEYEIILYLNNKTKKEYKSSSKKTRQLISARLNDGFTVENFKKVIDIKVQQWEDDLYWSKYLRPETLFGTKFESYLNETPKNGHAKIPQPSDIQTAYKLNPNWKDE